MIPFFALTFRGLESISVQEMAQYPTLYRLTSGYRQVRGQAKGALDVLLSLRTVDDVFIEVGTWSGIARPRASLALLQELALHTDWRPSIAICRSVRPIPAKLSFSVTASFVGKRNYTTDEIKQAIAQSITTRQGWRYADDDRQADLNVRLFIENDRALVGVRLGREPVHRRPYSLETQSGSLKPPVAAVMTWIARQHHARRMVDPCCGSGILGIEAAHWGLLAEVGDIHPLAVDMTRTNAQQANIALHIAQWDMHRLPLASGSVDSLVANPPWGKQVSPQQDLIAVYRGLYAEISRVLSAQGVAVILTTEELPSDAPLQCIDRLAMSLFGQQPSLWVLQH